MTTLDLAPNLDASRRVDETVTLRRCALYRKAFRGAAMSYPAEVLSFDAVAAWVVRHGVGVGVTTVDELDGVLAAGVSPLRIVMHGGSPSATRRAVDAGVGKFAVDSGQDVALLAGARRIQRVLIDVTDGSVDDLAADVMSGNRLDLIGLHCRLGDPGDETAVEIVRGMVGQMSRVRRNYGVILTRLSLAGLVAISGERRDLRRVADMLDDAVEDGCARHRYPRPALVLTPARSALLTTP